MHSIKWFFILPLLFIGGISASFGQILSVKSGNWDDPTVWSGGLVPTFSSGTITVRHTVHVRSSVYSSSSPLVIDQTTVGANGFSGYLIIDADAYVQVVNGGATDLALAGVPTVGKVDVAGRLILASGTVMTGNTTSNLNYLAGSTYEHQYVSAATALPAATYNASSTLLIDGITGSGTATAAWNVPLGNVVYNCAGQAAGVVNFAGFLRQIQGDLDIQNTGATGRISLNTAGTSTLASSSAITIGGHLSISGISRLWLTSTGTVEVYLGGDFIFNPNAASGTSQCVTTGSGTLQVSGNTAMSSGTWNFSSANNGTGIFNLLGNLLTTGTVLTETGGGTSQGNLNFNGALSQQAFDPAGVAATTMNVAINNSLNVKASGNWLLAGTLTLTNGSLILPGTTLTLNGPVAQIGGSLANDVSNLPSTPTLIIGGAGSLPANLTIVNGSTFDTFELNRASTTLTSNSNFTIRRLDLYAGTFANTGTVTINDGGLVDLQATSALLTGVLSQPLAAAGKYDVQYTNNVALTSGPELPTSSTPAVLNNLTKLGINTFTLNRDITINGNLVVSAGTLSDGGTSRTIDLVGNFISGGTSSTLGSSTFNFAAGGPSGTLSGVIAPTFGNLNFLHDVTINASLRVNSNIAVSSGATVNATSVTVSFGGTTTVTNSGAFNLNAVVILANSTLTAPSASMGVAGNFTATNATSVFNNNGGTMVFNGTSTLLGTGTKTFNHVTVAGTLNGAVNLTINGNLVNNGTINFTAGTLTFGGASSTITGTPVSTSFFTKTVSAGASVTSSIPFTTNGAYTVNGTAMCNSSFTASGALTVGAGGLLTANNAPFAVLGALTVTAPGICIADPGADATLAGNVTVTGTFTSMATTTISGAITLGGTGSKTWKDLVITGTLTPNANYTITGNLSLSGTGTLAAGNSTTTFGGTTTLSNTGSGAITFNNVTIAAGNSLTTNSNVTITGTTFTGTGDYSSSAATIFGRAGTTTLTGAGIKSFKDITINSGTTVTPNAAYTVAGNLAVTGILSAGNNTATFDGVTAISITPPGTVAFNSVVINATKTLTSSSGTITVNGNFMDNGTFIANSGTVVFGGNTVSRVVNGSSVTGFFNMTLTNGTQATDLSIESNKQLFGVLTLAANARMDPDGSANTAVFTLRSTSDNPAADASIAALPSPALAPAQINGNITVQRFMSGEGRIYRYISTPVQGATVASWKDNFPITGTFSDPSNPGVVCGKTVRPGTASLFLYSETTLPGGAYVAFPASGTAASNPLTVGRGYAAFIRECTNPTIIDVQGTLTNTVNMGTVNLPVTFTPAATTHFNLVGNPYPSAIDWDNFNTRTNVSGTIAVRDNATGVFQYWTNTTLGTNGFGDVPNGVIAQGQGFWVTTTGAAPVLRLTEAAKVASPASSGNIFYREATQGPDLLQIVVSGSTQTQIDKAYIFQTPQAYVGLDSIDGPKLDNYIDDPFAQLFDLYTSVGTNGIALAVNALPAINCNTQITLSLRDSKVGTYSYTFHKSGAVNNLVVHLFDKFTAQTTDVTENSSYSFSITSAAASQALDRFSITFSENPVNLDLSVEGAATVCDPAGSSAILVKSAEDGITYFAELNNLQVGSAIQGAGADITFSIPNNQLQPGLNHVVVKATSICTTSALNQDFTITKDSIVTAHAESASNCRSGSVTLRASGAPLSGSYLWYEASDTTTAIAGQTADAFVTPVLDKTKTYYVAAVNGNGCSGPKVLAKAEIVNYDDAVVTATGTPPAIQLQSNSQTGNQWYLNGEVIAGATSAAYSTSVLGDYTVVITTGNCTSTSAPYTNMIDVVAGLGDTDSNFPGITLSPNPVAGLLTIKIQAQQMPSVIIYNVMGQRIGQVVPVQESTLWTGQYNFTGAPSGLYVIQVADGEKKSSYRVVKE